MPLNEFAATTPAFPPCEESESLPKSKERKRNPTCFRRFLVVLRVNRAMTEEARRTIVVCDSSKFGRRSLTLIMPVSAMHETITDKGVSRHDLKALQDVDVEVTLV